MEEGSFRVKGIEVSNKSLKEIRKIGIAHVPEDRLETGLPKEVYIWENLIMGIQREEPYPVVICRR